MIYNSKTGPNLEIAGSASSVLSGFLRKELGGDYFKRLMEIEERGWVIYPRLDAHIGSSQEGILMGTTHHVCYKEANASWNLQSTMCSA